MPLLSNYFKISDTVIGIISLLGDISTCLIIVLSTMQVIYKIILIIIFYLPKSPRGGEGEGGLAIRNLGTKPVCL